MSAFDITWVLLKQGRGQMMGRTPDDEHCDQCGGVIPKIGGGPYAKEILCDCP